MKRIDGIFTKKINQFLDSKFPIEIEIPKETKKKFQISGIIFLILLLILIPFFALRKPTKVAAAGDFKVQQISYSTAEIATGQTQKTLSAPNDFTAVGSTSNAFLLPGNTFTAQAGHVNNRDGSWSNANIALIGADLTATNTIALTRNTSDASYTTGMDFNIVEYTGSGGGANEFLIRDRNTTSLTGTTNSTTTSAISSVSNYQDVVVIATVTSTSASTSYYNRANVIAYMNSSKQVVIERQGTTSVDIIIYYQVVEFTGNNWSVWRYTHDMVSAGSQENVTITGVGDLSKTFVIGQQMHDDNGLDEIGARIWLTTTTNLAFRYRSTSTTTKQTQAYVIKNSDSDMDVQRGSHSFASGSATENETGFTAINNLTRSFGLSNNDCNGTGTAFNRPAIQSLLTSTSNLRFNRGSYTGQAGDMRWQVVELPVGANSLTDQLHFRWRNDTTDLNTTGGWLDGAAEDSNTINDITKNTTYRIRIEVANTGGAAESSSRQYELQWGEKTGSSCNSISTWTGIGDATDEFIMKDTTYISPDGESTSPALLSNSESYTYTTGEGKDVLDTTGSIGPLSANYYTESEYSFQATDDAVTGATYCFRLYDKTGAGSDLDEYSVYPKVTISSVTIASIIGEVGQDSTDYNRKTITLSNTYTNPVVIAEMIFGDNTGPTTNRPAAIQIKNITSNSFTAKVQEPDDENDDHGTETFNYIVMEKGSWTLPNGAKVDVGTLSTSSYFGASVTGDSDADCNFTNSFSSTPVVVSAIQTDNNDGSPAPDFLTVSQLNVTSSDFDCAMEVPKNNSTAPGSAETIGWIAMESGTGTNNSVRYEVGNSGSANVGGWADIPWRTVNFTNSWFSSAPQVVANKQNRNGGDGGWFRYDDLIADSIDLAVDEGEEPDGGDRSHGSNELGGFIAFESSDDIVTDAIAYDQTTYRFYQNADSVQPGSALGNENTAITDVATNDIIRIRTAIQVGMDDLAASSQAFKLQYGQGSTCSSIGTWTDIDGISGSGIWRGYNNTTPADGTTVTASLLNSQNNTLESYEEENNSVDNPTAISKGSRGEWDWVIQNNGAGASTDYCFRTMTSDGDVIQYTNYPKLTTAASSNQNPDSPSSFVQKKTNDTTLATGDWTNETSVKFTATVTDPDSDQVQLCVEKDPLGTGFSDTEDLCGSLVNSGQTASVTITSQTDDTEYHWQARTKDSNGAYSSWVSYGGNGEGERDYGIDTSAPTGGTVNDGTGGDQDWNDGTLDSISANWNSFDATVSGLNKYEYATRRKPDDYYWNESTSTWQSGEVWYDNSTSTSKTVGSIYLQTETIYYFSLRATDNAGNTTSPINSDGQQVSPEFSFTINTNSLTFDDLNDSNSWTDLESSNITTSTNAHNGYVTTAYITDYLRSIPYASNYIDDFQGTYSTPETWEPGEYGFGYTTSDTDVNSGKFVGSKYAAFSHTALGDSLADHTAYVTGQTGKVTSEQFTITYKVAVDIFQAASPYQIYVTYICTAEF